MRKLDSFESPLDNGPMIGNGYDDPSRPGIGGPDSHRDPVRKIRLEIDPLVMPSEMTRPSELLAFGPEGSARGQLAIPGIAPLKFAIKRHRATRLHTDFRFESFGWLLSWASYDKPCFDPRRSIRLREMGDHRREYMRSERRIPDGSYGAGPMIVWDEGTYRPIDPTPFTDEEAVVHGLRQGLLDVWLEGTRTKGGFRFRLDERGWSLTKLPDEFVVYGHRDLADVSVISGRTLDHIELEYQRRLIKQTA